MIDKFSAAGSIKSQSNYRLAAGRVMGQQEMYFQSTLSFKQFGKACKKRPTAVHFPKLYILSVVSLEGKLISERSVF